MAPFIVAFWQSSFIVGEMRLEADPVRILSHLFVRSFIRAFIVRTRISKRPAERLDTASNSVVVEPLRLVREAAFPNPYHWVPRPALAIARVVGVPNHWTRRREHSRRGFGE
jgi:hypothetical protein